MWHTKLPGMIAIESEVGCEGECYMEMELICLRD